MSIDLVDLTVDYAFKWIFGQEENRDILARFLNTILELPEGEQLEATGLELLNPNMDRQHVEDKYSILDIHGRGRSGVQFNIEIQRIDRNDMQVRPLYYWSRMFSAQIVSGQDYRALTRTISINILTFRLFEETPDYHSRFHLREDQRNWLLTDRLEIHYLELPKLVEGRVDLDKPEVKWLLYLKGVDEEVFQMIAKEEPLLQKVRTVQELMSLDRQARAEYESRLKGMLDERLVQNRMREAEEGTKRLEEEKLRLEEERLRLEGETRRAEEEARKAEAETRRAEEEVRKAEEASRIERRSTLMAVISSRFGANGGSLEPLVQEVSSQPLPADLLPALLSAGSEADAERVLRRARTSSSPL